MEIIILPEARADLEYWKKSGDKRAISRITQLVNSIISDYKTGVGHPEPLKGNLEGFWSRRINKKNRIVYKPIEEEDRVLILSLRGHYSDK